ncbi:MAG: hypothetical protein KAS99_01215 [Candidatus Omnitrophica bacterium]|nr:hypothetical protein [Candidatus Omnitrophota bacterium]
MVFALIVILSLECADATIFNSSKKTGGKVAVKTGKRTEGLDASVIISKMIDSYGGLEKWQAIRGWSSIILIEDYSLDGTQMCKHYIRLPDKFRFDVEVNRGGKEEVFQLIYNAGTIKYLKDGKEVERTPSEMFLFLEETLRRFQRIRGPTQIKHWNSIKDWMDLIGKQTVKGRECYVLEYRKSKKTKTKLFVDTGTFRRVKKEVDRGYNDKFIEVFHGDKTLKANGIEVPVSKLLYYDGELVSKLEFRSLSFALPDESLFEF